MFTRSSAVGRRAIGTEIINITIAQLLIIYYRSNTSHTSSLCKFTLFDFGIGIFLISLLPLTCAPVICYHNIRARRLQWTFHPSSLCRRSTCLLSLKLNKHANESSHTHKVLDDCLRVRSCTERSWYSRESNQGEGSSSRNSSRRTKERMILMIKRNQHSCTLHKRRKLHFNEKINSVGRWRWWSFIGESVITRENNCKLNIPNYTARMW